MNKRDNAETSDQMLQALPSHGFELRCVRGSLYELRPRVGPCEVTLQIKKDGWINIAGQRYAVSREPKWGDYVLHLNTVEIARATKGGAFSWEFQIQAAGQQFRLKNLSAISSNFASNRVAADTAAKSDELMFHMRKRGFWRTYGDVTVQQTLPMALLAFQAWLAMLMWMRADDQVSVPSVG